MRYVVVHHLVIMVVVCHGGDDVDIKNLNCILKKLIRVKKKEKPMAQTMINHRLGLFSSWLAGQGLWHQHQNLINKK